MRQPNTVLEWRAREAMLIAAREARKSATLRALNRMPVRTAAERSAYQVAASAYAAEFLQSQYSYGGTSD